MSEKLKPCPFCGGEPEIVQIGNEATKKRGFEVRCLTFGCATKKRAMVIRHSLEEARDWAIKAWDARVHNPEIVLMLANYRDDLKRPPSGDSKERRLAAIEALLANSPTPGDQS